MMWSIEILDFEKSECLNIWECDLMINELTWKLINHDVSR